MKLLIAGFGELGSTLATTCQQRPGWERTTVLAIRRHPPEVAGGLAVGDLAAGQLTWLGADLANASSLSAIADQLTDVTHVVYCAAPSERTEAAYRATYVTGLQNLVAVLTALGSHTTNPNLQTQRSSITASESAPLPVAPPVPTAQPLPQLLFVSSTAVYDSQTKGEFDETSPTEPRGFNGKVLLEAEQWLLDQWPGALVLRLSGIYGPSKQSLLRSIANGTSTTPESPDYIANRIHIEDAANAILHLFDNRLAGVFIGTDSHPMPLIELYRQLARLLGAPTPPTGQASPMMGKKSLSNKKLLSTGFSLKWPSSLDGYEALIKARES